MLTSLAGAVATPLASANAQPSGRALAIGYLSAGTPGTRPDEAFRQGLRDVGYVEDGKNFTVHYRFAEDSRERLAEFVAELVAMNVDAIVATGGAVLAVHRTTSTIPVVFLAVTDPVRFGFVRSLARPGGNMTGFSYVGLELNAKRLEVFKELLPRATRFAALVSSKHLLHARIVGDIEAAASSLAGC